MSRLLKATYDCEVITPMFLAGADQTKPEFRISSIKAELRFWLRAVLGGLLNQNLNQVALIEQLIFGGTNNQSNQSNVQLKFVNPKKITTDYLPMLPHKKGNLAKQNAINPKNRFEIEIKTVGNNSIFFFGHNERSVSVKSELIYNIALDVFQLSILLGSLGRRSNRGFGSVQINKINDERYYSFTSRKTVKQTITEIFNELNKGLMKLAKHLQNKGIIKLSNSENKNQAGISKWPILDNKYTQITIGKPVAWDEFIYDLMKTIHIDKGKNKLKEKVLGDFKPRQGSTMKISMIRADEKDLEMYPVFTNFITDTKGKPNRKDFEYILSFPEKICNNDTLVIFDNV